MRGGEAVGEPAESVAAAADGVAELQAMEPEVLFVCSYVDEMLTLLGL